MGKINKEQLKLMDEIAVGALLDWGDFTEEDVNEWKLAHDIEEEVIFTKPFTETI